MVMQDVTREEGLAEELAFWDGVMRTGGEWPEEIRDRLDPNLPLQEEFRALVPNAGPGDTVRILDVGAGPFTTIGKVWPGRRVDIVPNDPLAAEYARLLDKYGLTPPVRTLYLAGEDTGFLTMAWAKHLRYDIAYARNSLDHAVDPVACIQGMLDVVKPGGYVFLQHSVREADKQGRQGLHQWNFYADGTAGCKHFFIEGHDVTTNVSLKFEDRVCYEKVQQDRWIDVVMRRRP